MVRQTLLLDLSFSPIQCFHTFAVWKHFLYLCPKHGMPCRNGAFALSETFGQSLFGESRTAFCILLVRFRQSELHPYVPTPDFITFLCHHIAHIENQWVVSFDWVTHWRSLQKTLPLNATTKRYHKTQALMGAMRLASGIKAKIHRQACI